MYVRLFFDQNDSASTQMTRFMFSHCHTVIYAVLIEILFKHIFDRFFRVISAEQYLTEFSSDRRHMRRPDGTWIKPPPPYPPIQSSGELKYS